jgi:hypothetical protein
MLADGAAVEAVVGSKAQAEDGELVLLAAAPEDVRARCAPVFDTIARRAVWLDAPRRWLAAEAGPEQLDPLQRREPGGGEDSAAVARALPLRRDGSA